MHTNKHESIYIDNNRLRDSIFSLTAESKHVLQLNQFSTILHFNFLPSLYVIYNNVCTHAGFC